MTTVSFVAIRRSDMSYQQKRFYLFNCEHTYSLETVEKLMLEQATNVASKSRLIVLVLVWNEWLRCATGHYLNW